jgi:peptide/nickel transport system substrate-binding protein
MAFLMLLAVACGTSTAPETSAPAKAAPEAAAPAKAAPEAAAKAAPEEAAPEVKKLDPIVVQAEPVAVPEVKVSAEAKDVNPGKVTVMVAALGNERFDKSFSSGADKNQGRMLHGMLVETNEKTELIPGLASSWSLSEDGHAWNYTIREGVKYHDGTEMTPEDVRWSLDHQYGPGAYEYTSSSTSEAFSKIMEKVEILDPGNVVSTRFTRVETGFMPYATSAAGATWLTIIPERDALRDEAIEKAYEKNPIGNGPFKFVAHVPAELIAFERFADHYFQPAYGLYEDRTVNFTQMDLRAVPEEATRVAALRAGEADIAPVSIGAKKQVEKGGGKLVFGPEGGYFRTILVGCWSDPNFPCHQKKVRHALAYAIDKEMMRDQLYGPDVMEIKGWAVVTPGVIGYTPEMKPFPFDPEKARSLLTEAGYKNPDNPGGKDFGKLMINTWTSSVFPFLPESAQLAAENWKVELGIDTEVVVGDETALKKAHRAGDLDGTVLWRDNETRIDAGSISRSSYGNPTTSRRLHDDQELFDLVNETLAIYDPSIRTGKLTEMYLRFQDEQREISMGYINIPWAVGPRIESWNPYPLAFWLSSYHSIILK